MFSSRWEAIASPQNLRPKTRNFWSNFGRSPLGGESSGTEKGPSERIQALLQLGADQFGVENGHLTRIDPPEGSHSVVEVSSPYSEISSGDEAAVIEVKDTGIGMDPEKVEALFEPLRQESEGVNRKYEGSGLGLAIARRASRQMGGAIDVETEKGEESFFILRLPRSETGRSEGKTEK